MLTAAGFIAANNFGDTRTGGMAGPMGLFLIVVLATATVLLIRNMNARLRRLPEHFPDQRRADDQGRAASSVLDPTEIGTAQESPSTAPNGPQQH
jgi:hypothetical protein